MRSADAFEWIVADPRICPHCAMCGRLRVSIAHALRAILLASSCLVPSERFLDLEHSPDARPNCVRSTPKSFQLAAKQQPVQGLTTVYELMS